MIAKRLGAKDMSYPGDERGKKGGFIRVCGGKGGIMALPKKRNDTQRTSIINGLRG